LKAIRDGIKGKSQDMGESLDSKSNLQSSVCMESKAVSSGGGECWHVTKGTLSNTCAKAAANLGRLTPPEKKKEKKGFPAAVD